MWLAIANIDFFSGQFNPHFFNYPSLFIYLAALAHLLISGFVTPSGNQIWAISHDILLHARLVSALFGALTVPVTYALARQIGGARLGILAALLLCFAPAHVQHSHFATVDIAATFWVALSLFFATRVSNFRDAGNVENENRDRENFAKNLLLSALCAGLGAATKYNALLVLAAPLAALLVGAPHFEYSKRGTPKRGRLALGIVAVAVGGFLLGCPFSALDFREFWGDGRNLGFAYELLVHPKQGSGDIFVGTGNGWLFHALFNVPFAMTAPVALAAFFGLLLLLDGMWKRRKTDAAAFRVLVPTLAFSLLYFFALGFSQVRFLRYVLPLLPVLAIFAALFVRAVFSALRIEKTNLKVALSAVFLLIPALGTLNILWPLTQTDPRDAAKNWLDAQNFAPPISVGLADEQNPLWFYTPPFWPQDLPPGSSLPWQNVAKNARYDLRAIGLDAAKLRAEKPRYFAWSEFQWRDRDRLGATDAAQLRAQLKIEYSIRAFENVAPLQLPGRAFVPHDFLYTNPRVEMWTRK